MTEASKTNAVQKNLSDGAARSGPSASGESWRSYWRGIGYRAVDTSALGKKSSRTVGRMVRCESRCRVDRRPQ